MGTIKGGEINMFLADANNVDLGEPVVEEFVPTSTPSGVDKVLEGTKEVANVIVKPEWQTWLSANWWWIVLGIVVIAGVVYFIIRRKK